MERPFEQKWTEGPAVRGFLHQPESPNGEGLVLTHGADSDARAPLLEALARELAAMGFTVLRVDLPFRQQRAQGPPAPSDEPLDREGLKRALECLGSLAPARLYLGGHSYGARQATLLAAENPEAADALLLLGYPLYLPEKPDAPRSSHFPKLRTPALFVHGSKDPFGRLEEMRAALQLIPARTELLEIPGVGHRLGGADSAPQIAAAFRRFLEQPLPLPITDVLDLHTVPPREVKPVLEAWLEEVQRAGLRAVRIIHGRGIGVQREIVRAVLKRTPSVESFADAPPEAGGWGATVVTFRD